MEASFREKMCGWEDGRCGKGSGEALLEVYRVYRVFENLHHRLLDIVG